MKLESQDWNIAGNFKERGDIQFKKCIVYRQK